MSADYLQLPSVEGLQVKDGVVTWAKDERKRVSYAKLVEGKRIERHLEKVPVKPVSAFTVIGRAPRRKDALEKVTGKAQYAANMALPGTLHAHGLRPPAHGATLKEVDTTAAEKIPGVRGNRSDNGPAHGDSKTSHLRICTHSFTGLVAFGGRHSSFRRMSVQQVSLPHARHQGRRHVASRGHKQHGW